MPCEVLLPNSPDWSRAEQLQFEISMIGWRMNQSRLRQQGTKLGRRSNFVPYTQDEVNKEIIRIAELHREDYDRRKSQGLVGIDESTALFYEELVQHINGA